MPPCSSPLAARPQRRISSSHHRTKHHRRRVHRSGVVPESPLLAAPSQQPLIPTQHHTQQHLSYNFKRQSLSAAEPRTAGPRLHMPLQNQWVKALADMQQQAESRSRHMRVLRPSVSCVRVGGVVIRGG